MPCHVLLTSMAQNRPGLQARNPCHGTVLMYISRRFPGFGVPRFCATPPTVPQTVLLSHRSADCKSRGQQKMFSIVSRCHDTRELWLCAMHNFRHFGVLGILRNPAPPLPQKWNLLTRRPKTSYPISMKDKKRCFLKTNIKPR